MNNKKLFEETPILKAVISLALPTVISQLLLVVYNMADTFFVGQVGDPNQVAAAAICMPLFVVIVGMSNLFGIGGASLIARCLGKGDVEKARKVSAFSIWSVCVLALVYGLLVYAFRGKILPFVGANEGTFTYCSQYVLWTVTVGAVPTVLNSAFAHLVRSEGYSRQASMGMTIGAGLNIILDPIFISLLKLEIAGAAIATMLSNLAAAIYFIVLITKKRGNTVLTFDPRCYSLGFGIPKEVVLVGLPSCVMSVMGVVSNVCLNRLIVSYCNEAVAGIGIAKRIDMLTFAIAMGMSQGVIPLIGYNYAAKNYKRMMAGIRTTLLLSLSIAVLGTVFLLTCARPIVRAFIDDPLTVGYGEKFQRIICTTGPCFSVSMLVITLFQAVGKKIAPLILSLLRKGGLDVPLMFLLNRLIGIDGVAWSSPAAELLSMVIAVVLFVPFWRELKQKLEGSGSSPSVPET